MAAATAQTPPARAEPPITVTVVRADRGAQPPPGGPSTPPPGGGILTAGACPREGPWPRSATGRHTADLDCRSGRRARGVPDRHARQPPVEGRQLVAGLHRHAADAALPRAAAGEGPARLPPGVPPLPDGRAVLALVRRPRALRPGPGRPPPGALAPVQPAGRRQRGRGHLARDLPRARRATSRRSTATCRPTVWPRPWAWCPIRRGRDSAAARIGARQGDDPALPPY